MTELADFTEKWLKWPNLAILANLPVYRRVFASNKRVNLPRNLEVSWGIWQGYSTIHDLAWWTLFMRGHDAVHPLTRRVGTSESGMYPWVYRCTDKYKPRVYPYTVHRDTHGTHWDTLGHIGTHWDTFWHPFGTRFLVIFSHFLPKCPHNPLMTGPKSVKNDTFLDQKVIEKTDYFPVHGVFVVFWVVENGSKTGILVQLWTD